MNRSSILAAVITVAMFGAGCKKDPAQTNVTPAPDTSGAVLASASISAAAKAPAPADEGVKFARKPLAVGTKRTEESKMQMSMKLTMLKKTMEMQEDESTKKDEEVLEVDGDKATKLKVTFAEDQKAMSEGGKPAKARPSAIAGKTYVLVAKDGKTTVLNDKEKPAPAAQAKLVAKQYESFGKADPVTAALPDRALKPGDAIPELVDGLTKEMKAQASDDKISVEGVKVVFNGKVGDTGVFGVELTMKVAEGPFKMTMPLKGTVSLHLASGWPAAMVLEGPLNFDLTEKDKAQGVEGSGTLKMASSYTYQ